MATGFMNGKIEKSGWEIGDSQLRRQLGNKGGEDMEDMGGMDEPQIKPC